LKFDHLLQIYWTYKFLYGGNTFEFGSTLISLFKNLSGVSLFTQNRYFQKHEVNYKFSKKLSTSFSKLKPDNRLAMNFFLGQLLNVNASIFEWERINSLRNFLIKSYKGRALAIGKPIHGQRTHSNAFTAKHHKSPFKSFVSTLRQLHFKKNTTLRKWQDPRIRRSFVSRLTKIIRRRKKQLPKTDRKSVV